MTLETISNEDPQQPPYPGAGTTPAPALRSGARATALTTAVSLVLVGGVVTAAVRGNGHSGTAEKLAPASTFAFAQVDLSLADGQSNALSSFLGHFPDSPTHKGKGSIRDRVLRAMLRDSSDPHVDYDKDVKPWLGDHAAVAGWLDTTGKPQVEFLLQSKNDGAARKSLHRADPKLGIAFSHGYAVVGETQPLADAAVKAAGKSSLASSAHFHSDISKLNGAQLISGWADVTGALAAVRKAAGGADPFATLPRGLFGGNVLNQVKGRFVFGVHATKTYAEVTAQAIDAAPATPTSGLSSDMLTGLPDGTIGAAAIASPDKIVSTAWSALSGFFGVISSSKCPPNTVGCPPVSPPAASSIADQVEQATGLRLPGDVETLLGSAMVIAYGGLQPQGLPKVALVTRPTNITTARALAEHARDVIARNAPLQLSVGARGSDLVVATSDDYRDAVATGGHLGGQPGFTEAMGQLPSQIGFAAYVNLGAIVPLFSHGQPDLNSLAGFGMWASRDKFQVRLVVH